MTSELFLRGKKHKVSGYKAFKTRKSYDKYETINQSKVKQHWTRHR